MDFLLDLSPRFPLRITAHKRNAVKHGTPRCGAFERLVKGVDSRIQIAETQEGVPRMTPDLLLVHPPCPLWVSRIQGILEPHTCRVQVDQGASAFPCLRKCPATPDPCEQCHAWRDPALRQKLVGNAANSPRTISLRVEHGEHVQGKPLKRPLTRVTGQHVRFEKRVAGGGVLPSIEEKPSSDFRGFRHCGQVAPLRRARDLSVIKPALGRAPHLNGDGRHRVPAVLVGVSKSECSTLPYVRDI